MHSTPGAVAQHANLALARGPHFQHYVLPEGVPLLHHSCPCLLVQLVLQQGSGLMPQGDEHACWQTRPGMGLTGNWALAPAERSMATRPKPAFSKAAAPAGVRATRLSPSNDSFGTPEHRQVLQHVRVGMLSHEHDVVVHACCHERCACDAGSTRLCKASSSCKAGRPMVSLS